MQRTVDWTTRAATPPLEQGDVHLWRVRVPDAGGVPDHWLASLSEDEKAGAARKRIPLDARRTLTSRACLRILLGDYLAVPPRSIALTTTAHGKPQLAAPASSPPVEFNVSHSGDWVVVAIARGLPLGVDVECHRELEFDRLVSGFFSPSERETWSKIPSTEHAFAFFSAWTRKEAYLKALGLGLSKRLDSFTVVFAADSPAALLWCASDPQAPARWSIAAVDLAPHYSCAVAVGAAARSLYGFTFDPTSFR